MTLLLADLRRCRPASVVTDCNWPGFRFLRPDRAWLDRFHGVAGGRRDVDRRVTVALASNGLVFAWEFPPTPCKRCMSAWANSSSPGTPHRAVSPIISENHDVCCARRGHDHWNHPVRRTRSQAGRRRQPCGRPRRTGPGGRRPKSQRGADVPPALGDRTVRSTGRNALPDRPRRTRSRESRTRRIRAWKEERKAGKARRR